MLNTCGQLSVTLHELESVVAIQHHTTLLGNLNVEATLEMVTNQSIANVCWKYNIYKYPSAKST